MFTAFKSQSRLLLRLIYWLFFKPSALRTQLRQIAPELLEEEFQFRATWNALRTNSALRGFSLNTLVLILLAPFVLNIALGWAIMATGSNFDWSHSLVYVGASVLLGVATYVLYGGWIGGQIGMLAGVTFGVGVGLVFGVVSGVAGGVGGGLDSIESGVVEGMALGAVIVVALDQVMGLAFAVTICVALGAAMFIIFSVMSGAAYGIGVGLAVGASAIRLPFYIFEILPALRAYRHAQHSDNPMQDLKHSPIYLDELLVLPQPYLSSFLVLIARSNLHVGLQQIAYIASNPFQRWATERALRTLLAHDNVSFFLMLDAMLTAPRLYLAEGENRDERQRPADPYFAPKLLLAELTGNPPINRIPDALPRVFSAWLRMRGSHRYVPLAKAYLDLMNDAAWPKTDQMNLGPRRERYEGSLGRQRRWSEILSVLESARTLLHGEEIYQSFRIADAALRCENLEQISRLHREFAPLFAIEIPLRPDIVNIFRCLEDATTDATASLGGMHPITRSDALLKAQGVLQEARRAAGNIYEPERHILLKIIEQWGEIFVQEGTRVAERVKVTELPNPYVAGRALSPADEKLFVGRRGEFRQIEETLKSGVTIVLYGQRRIGKSSILLHLSEHLSHNLLPVYLNLQRIQAESPAGLLHRLGEEIAVRLHEAHWYAPVLSPFDTFRGEPFLAFDTFLRDVEVGLHTDQRVVLVFDEFEELEQQVHRGQFDNRIFTFMRGITQTGRGFAIVFAGLHTLEQMSHDYWNPFFLSVKPIKVTYLSETDVRQLITEPIVRFPLEYNSQATERIIAITHGQPYLVQDLCHNLVTYLNDPLHRKDRATVEDVNAVIERTLGSGTYYFDDYVWGWSSDDERLAMSVIAETTRTAGSGGGLGMVAFEQVTIGGSVVTTDSGWVGFLMVEKYLGREGALAALKNLCGRDILEERASGEMLEYRFQVELSRLWVARTKPLARILLERK